MYLKITASIALTRKPSADETALAAALPPNPPATEVIKSEPSAQCTQPVKSGKPASFDRTVIVKREPGAPVQSATKTGKPAAFEKLMSNSPQKEMKTEEKEMPKKEMPRLKELLAAPIPEKLKPVNRSPKMDTQTMASNILTNQSTGLKIRLKFD